MSDRPPAGGADRPESRRRREAPARRWQLVLYRVVRTLIVGVCRSFWRVDVTGREHVPVDRPFILAPVHRGNVDTPLVAALTTRRLRYLGKDGLWRFRWSAWFFDHMGGFPVRRGSPDREAMRWAERVLDAGEPVVMFPEGTRRRGPIVQREELLDGVAFVALRKGVDIVPVGIGGSGRAIENGSKILWPGKLTLVVGPPLEVAPPAPGERVPRRSVRELTDRLRDELQLLYDEAQARAGR